MFGFSAIRHALGRFRWYLEAVFCMAVARAFVRFLPYKMWRWTLGTLNGTTNTSVTLTPRQQGQVSATRRWIFRAAPRMPFEAVCLPQAMAGFWMLKRRGIPGRITFGAGKSTENKDLSFHAWLLVGEEYVTGQRTEIDFKPLQN